MPKHIMYGDEDDLILVSDFYQVIWEGDAGGAILNGTEYKLLQCHWHTPSEHTLNGRRLSSNQYYL